MTRLVGQLLILGIAAALWHGGAAQNATAAEIVIIPDDTTAVEGNTLILTCVGSGVPSPVVTWLKGGENVLTALDGSRVSVNSSDIEEGGVTFVQTTLEICSLELTDAGMYSCVATNDNGTETHSLQVDVEARERVEIVIQPESSAFQAGNTAILTCVGFGYPDNPNITWSRGGVDIEATGTVRIYQEVLEEGGLQFVVSILEICGISLEDDGVYSCSATLQSGLLDTSSDFWVNVTAGAPEIVIAPEDSEVNEGNTIILTCVALATPLPEVLWTFDGRTISNVTNPRVSVYSGLVEEGGVTFVSSMLEICSAEPEDAGQYSCVAREGERNASIPFSLSVVETDEAEVVIAPQDTSVTLGNTALFTCVARGSPTPSILWLKDGNAIPNDSRVRIYDSQVELGGFILSHSILELCSVELEDGGYYMCVANNSVGNSSSSSFQVEVTDESVPEIVIAPSDSTVREGNTVLFTCVAFGNTPPEILWFRNGQKLYNITRTMVYTTTIAEGQITFVRSILELCSAEASDEGEYLCVAAVPNNPSRNSSIDFSVDIIVPEEQVAIVIAPPDSVVTENTTALFTCVVFGSPLPTTIMWTFTRENYTTTLYNTSDVNIYYDRIYVGGAAFLQSILELCGVGEERAGYYMCSAESSAGIDSDSFELIVQPLAPPEILIAPSDSSVYEEQTVLFTCVAQGMPTPSLSWYRADTGVQLWNGTTSGRIIVYNETFNENGVEFVMSVLEICSAESEDEGEYSCLASSSSGYDVANFSLTVEPPLASPTIVIAPPNTEVVIDSTVLLTCVATGNPTPSISWYAGNSMLTNDSRVVAFMDVVTEGGVVFTRSILQLCGVSKDDEALYTCVASNDVNISQSSFFLIVIEPPTIAIKPSDTNAPYNSTVLLTCVAVGEEDGITNIFWQKDSESISDSSGSVQVFGDVVMEGGVNFTRSILQLCSVTFEEEGTYSCVANNSAGTTSADFSVSVFTEVSIVMISNNTQLYAGGTGLFMCVATGTPDPYITWQVNGEDLLGSDRIKITVEFEESGGVTFVKSILEVCDAQTRDAAEYVCVAEVPRLNDTASFNLDVLTMAPTIEISPAHRIIVNGTVIGLECQATGAPRPSIVWTVDGDVIESGVEMVPMSVITVYSTVFLGAVTASADYVCNATNDLGSDSATASVIVQFPISVATNPDNITVLVGNEVTFSCLFSGSPVPSSIQWFKEGDSNPLSVPKYTSSVTNEGLYSMLSFVTELDDHNTRYYCRAYQTLVTGETVATSEASTLTVNSNRSILDTWLAPPVLSNSFENNMFISVLNGTLILNFIISDAQPPVAEDGVMWTFKPSTAPKDSEPTVIDSTMSERYEFESTETYVRLRIQPVELEDEGTYTVNVSNIAGSDTDFVVVNVVIGARIINAPNDTTVHVGQNATFTCVATSEPVHDVIWKYDNTNLTNGEKYVITNIDDATSELVIVNVAVADGGEYVCDVRNDHGVDEDVAILTVISTPVVTATTVSPLITLEGVPITLIFTVTDDIPPVVTEANDWSVVYVDIEGSHTIAPEDPRFSFSNDFRTLTIDPVEAADEGVYTLTAMNTAGMDSASIEVDVQFAPTITLAPEDVETYIGENSTFSCAATGEPNPDISWTFMGDVLSTDDKYTVSSVEGSLVVHSVTAADEGDYVCSAANSHSTATASAFLQPLSTPVVTATTVSPLITLEGVPITLIFTVTDDIPPVVTVASDWSVVYVDIEGSHTIAPDSHFSFSNDFRTLTIDPVEAADEGVYTLTAMNTAGMDSASIEVDVQFAPTITLAPENVETYIGENSTFSCAATGEPNPDISWTFMGDVLSTDDNYTISSVEGSLVVHSVTADDEGDYVCSAANSHRTATASAFLQPLSIPVVTTDMPNRTGLLDNETTLSFTITNDIPLVVPSDIRWFFVAGINIGSASGGDPMDVSGSGDIGSALEEGMYGGILSEDRRSLTFSELQYSNEGTYTVRVENIAAVTYAQIYLDVQAVPRVEITASEFREHEGESITFTCTVIAEPVAKVEFLFESENITGGGERHNITDSPGTEYYMMVYSLVIVDLMTSDAGQYQCIAMNEHGSDTDAVTLEVLVEPEITPQMRLYQFIADQTNVQIAFISSNREYPSLVPSNVTMRFQSMSGDILDVEDDDYRQLSEDGLTLFLTVIPEHNGTYWIVATNDAGTTISQTITVEVFVNPTVESAGEVNPTVREGTSVTFECVATGNPSPTFSWNKNGEFLVTSLARFGVNQTLTSADVEGSCSDTVCTTSGTLAISSVTLSDDGIYSCRASIGVDIPAAMDAVLDQPFNLTVNQIVTDFCADNTPCVFGSCSNVGRRYVCDCDTNYVGVNCTTFEEERTPPEFERQPDTLFIGIFEDAVFFCLVRGNPQPTIKWFRNRVEITGEVGQELVIPQAELSDRGEYYCLVTNTEGILESIVVVLNIDDIVQYRLIIVIARVSGRKKRQASNIERLVAMLNEQLTGTMIGNATVYSVAIQEDFDINSGSNEIPLIFTFYSEEEGDERPDTQPPAVEVNFDVKEIERVVEEDVMLFAMELGLNVTVEEFSRFDGCPNDGTSLDMDYNLVLTWTEAPIGFVSTLSCPCDVTDLGRSATRVCGGNFTAGAKWDSPLDTECDFTDITRQLCSSPELSVIETLVRDVANLERLGVAVVTQLLVDMVDTSSGNMAESNLIFNVIEDILKANRTELTLGQAEFNTSGRLLSSLEILVDAYPGTDTRVVKRDSFGFLLAPETVVDFDVTVSAVLGVSLNISEGSLSLGDVEGAAAKVELRNVDYGEGLVFGVYTASQLFSRRSEYIQTNNRSSFILGSVVVSVHFSRVFSRKDLNTPVLITLMKLPEAVENGTKTECSFWDQSLDSGYGAWATDGCRLVSESRNEAVCECDHLTQFALLVDLTPVEEEEDEDDDSIGAGSYVGGLVCIVFLIIILCTYLGSRDLRTSVLGVSLINCSICLCCLFISFLISYYTTESDWACTIFSAIFQYFFLVTSLSLLLLAILNTWQPERLAVLFSVLFILQLVIPAVIVIASAAPDQDNYIDDEFCRPQQEPYWYGLLLLAGIIHIISWCILLSGLCLLRVRYEKNNYSTLFEEWLGIALTLGLFELAWSFGLPSTNTLDLGATRLVFQIIFAIASAVLGLVMLVFFVLLSREARETWMGWFNSLIPGRTGGFYTDHTTDIEENLYVTGGGVGMSEMRSLGEDDEGAAKRGTGVEAMREKGEDPEHIVNPVALEHEEGGGKDGGGEYESEEAKVVLGMFDDDDDTAKDTKL